MILKKLLFFVFLAEILVFFPVQASVAEEEVPLRAHKKIVEKLKKGQAISQEESRDYFEEGGNDLNLSYVTFSPVYTVSFNPFTYFGFLTSLNLTCSNIEDLRVLNSLPNLEKLILKMVYKFYQSSKGIEFQNMSALRRLDVSDNILDNLSLKNISRASSLTELDLSGVIFIKEATEPDFWPLKDVNLILKGFFRLWEGHNYESEDYNIESNSSLKKVHAYQASKKGRRWALESLVLPLLRGVFPLSTINVILDYSCGE
jgi:hypothetical protein